VAVAKSRTKYERDDDLERNESVRAGGEEVRIQLNLNWVRSAMMKGSSPQSVLRPRPASESDTETNNLKCRKTKLIVSQGT